MDSADLQEFCEQGQALLMEMRYIPAEKVLMKAEALAWAGQDWDTLSRLYMPLQEARRQRRQRCGEGGVRFDFVAHDASDRLDPEKIIEQSPHGQLLVAGWDTIEPALRLRELAGQKGLFVETFLAAALTLPDGARGIVIVPGGDAEFRPQNLPADSIVLKESDVAKIKSYDDVMDLWERLHMPFLMHADAEVDPIRKMEGYRRTIIVDYACELAHQKLSDVARGLTREGKGNTQRLP